ncbi:hypothetical protein B0H10DRAFT_104509 [Mycena sp. CBHHK59/15]|nr:hypothetical protein B0H10DRAFT_104509 [Mycena sp. CBHHK59/15]
MGSTSKNVGQITFRPPPNPTTAPIPFASNTHRSQPSPHRQTTAAIVLEILGALAGCLLLISFMRCVYSYNRTPNRDRITAVLHRHQLQREMEELERNPPDRRGSLVEPPPPYLAPPSYPDNENTPLANGAGPSGYTPDARGDHLLPPNR